MKEVRNKTAKKYDGELFFAKVKENAIIPTKHEENAGYDVYCCCDEDIIINPHETLLVPTGIACAIDNGHYMQLLERGSTGSIGMKESCGVIDSSYRGEIFAAIYNGGDRTLVITDTVDKVDKNVYLYYPKKKAICQGVVLPVPNMNVKEISYDELKKIPSIRGDGKLGSSGK